MRVLTVAQELFYLNEADAVLPKLKLGKQQLFSVDN